MPQLSGKDHHNTKIPFSVVEQARDLRDYGKEIKEIMYQFEEWGYTVKYWTLVDWLYFRTRINS